MGFEMEALQSIAETENKQNGNRKRDHQVEALEEGAAKRHKLEEPATAKSAEVEKTTAAASSEQPKPHVQPQSPKRRLQLPPAQESKKSNKEKFIYGNYSQYYGYRNKDKDYHDIRLDVFDTQPALFCGKAVLDIGCNSGFITLEIAKRYAPQSITGIDIDRALITQAHRALVRVKKALPPATEKRDGGGDGDDDVDGAGASAPYPLNVHFVNGNYVLRDDVLLELERPQFDVILCLSITKWIHLNFGDAGLRQAFRRMFAQLRSGGRLVLEAQAYKGYGRRKKMNDAIFANYKAIQFLPTQFTEYLLSAEVGFSGVELMGVPEHCAEGFKRPIQIFTKA